MERHAPQLIVAQILVRENQQRFARAQREERLPGRERPLATWGDRLRVVIAGALVRLGERMAGTSPGNDEVIPAVASSPDPNVLTR